MVIGAAGGAATYAELNLLIQIVFFAKNALDRVVFSGHSLGEVSRVGRS
jgi:hypothetical protein